MMERADGYSDLCHTTEYDPRTPCKDVATRLANGRIAALRPANRSIRDERPPDRAELVDKERMRLRSAVAITWPRSHSLVWTRP